MSRKVAPLEAQLDRLADLRGQPPSPEARAEVARFLESKSNLVAAKAARVAGEWKDAELAPTLAAAFERFLENGETTDKRCAAKIEILKALCELEYPAARLFLSGLHYVQMEPSYGGATDSGAEVRALCAIGLAQTSYPDALEEILPLLLDRERTARIGAVRAIGGAGQLGGTLLLRLKALSHDEPEVRGECLAALLRAAPASSVDFVAGFLDHEEEAVAEAAALALGESRLESAYTVLRAAFEQAHTRAMGRTLLLALALLRRESAIDYLIDLVAKGDAQASAGAAAALDMYRQDPKLHERLEQAQRSRR